MRDAPDLEEVGRHGAKAERGDRTRTDLAVSEIGDIV